MADYNIYIHDATSGAREAAPTKAWSQNPQDSKQTKAWNPAGEIQDQEDPNVTPSFAALKNIWSMAKSHPIITTAIVVITLAVKVVDTATPFIAREGGDYRWSIEWNNLKASIGMCLKPASTVLNTLTARQQTNLFNKKQELDRQLIGEKAYTNLGGKKGV